VIDTSTSMELSVESKTSSLKGCAKAFSMHDFPSPGKSLQASLEKLDEKALRQ
jgi:hypothetical protein